MRISDWSSDVCSSDLAVEQPRRLLRSEIIRHRAALLEPVGRNREPAGVAEYLHLVGDIMFALLEPRAQPQEIVPLLLGKRRLERGLDDLPIMRIARRLLFVGAGRRARPGQILLPPAEERDFGDDERLLGP